MRSMIKTSLAAVCLCGLMGAVQAATPAQGAAPTKSVAAKPVSCKEQAKHMKFKNKHERQKFFAECKKTGAGKGATKAAAKVGG